MDAELSDRLTGNVELAALVGVKVYPMSAATGAETPFVVWQRISGVPAQGAMDGESDIVAARVQIDSYGDSYGIARSVADAVRASLRDWKESAGVIRDVTLDNDRALRETDPALKTFRVSQDYIITFIQ